MKYLKNLSLKNSFFKSFLNLFFDNFRYRISTDNLFFFNYKKVFILYLKFLYLKKLKNNLTFLFLLKKNKKIINLSYIILQKFKYNLNLLLLQSNAIILLQGRGFRLVQTKLNFLIFKLGFTHKIILKLNPFLSIQILTKNAQKFSIKGNLFNIIQIIACLNFLKKKNIFTSKGIFFNSEKLKTKKSTKSTW